MANYSYAIFLFLYVILIIYYVVLACFMLFWRQRADWTPAEQASKDRMTRTVGIAMGVWALTYLIYLPPLLCDFPTSHRIYALCYIISLMLSTSMVCLVMLAVLQKEVSIRRTMASVYLPFLLPVAWFFCLQEGDDASLPSFMAGALCLVCLSWLLVRYVGEYRRYVHRLRSEYSEISGREIIWSWSCFSGLLVQIVLFMAYQFFWMPALEPFYAIVSVINAAYLCYCTCRQIPLNYIAPEEEEEDRLPESHHEETAGQKAYYAVIEQKLETLCEEKLLFLDPDLTLVMLCQNLSVSRTYLGSYFRSHGLSFYQYINTLRVNYAVKFMQEHPGASIREVCEQSGFRSQTTFRKMFQQVTGHLPSEVKGRIS